jgi:hypothetical protein
MNGAIGLSDVEGKAARASGERVGRQASFKNGLLFLIREKPC